MWAQAWSEPQAGSDLAALRATALRDGDEYVLRGHKIWSSRAAYADGAPPPLPEEKADAEKYRARIARLKQSVSVHEKNVEALRKELASVK